MGAPSEGFEWTALDESFRPLPSIYLGFLTIWSVSAFSWTINTWWNRHFQMNNLKWMLATVPLLKSSQLGLSFLFWYSCINNQSCSLWISFGIYVTGVLFQTASFVSFLLISHGYCIMCERLSVPERRITAVHGCILYLILVGYKVAVPYFTVFLLLNYFITFYLIFRQTSQNLLVLREQLSFVEVEDIHALHDAILSKYSMFKKFQGAMQIVAVMEIVLYMNLDYSADTYWFRLLVREWAQLCIFLYLGWTFRSQEVSPHFFVMPIVKSKQERAVPPIYSLEMDAADFKDLASQEWQVGVATYFPSAQHKNPADSLLVIVQHPRAVNRTSETPTGQNLLASSVTTDSSQQTGDKVNFIAHATQTMLA